MTKKLPAKIFVRWEEPSNDEPYLIAGQVMYGLVEGAKVKIGTYQLVETVDAEMVVSTSKPTKAPKRQ